MATIELGNAITIGLFAARPNYAALEVGLEVNKALFIATDTGQLFAWDGATWHDVATTAGVDGLLDALGGIVSDGTNTTVELGGGALAWNATIQVQPLDTPLEKVIARTIELDPIYPLTEDNGKAQIGSPIPQDGTEGQVLKWIGGVPTWADLV